MTYVQQCLPETWHIYGILDAPQCHIVGHYSEMPKFSPRFQTRWRRCVLSKLGQVETKMKKNF
jgi:hypothetical protein